VDFVEELQAVVDSDDEIIVKHKMSCFYQTRLEEVLRLWGVSTLIVVGVSTYVCVESTIRDAYYRDFDIIVVEDCVAGSDEPLHRATLEKTRRYFGEVLSIKELEKSLAEQLREKTLE
jgi:ureidoacrylate peracid hydrolase